MLTSIIFFAIAIALLPVIAFIQDNVYGSWAWVSLTTVSVASAFYGIYLLS